VEWLLNVLRRSAKKSLIFVYCKRNIMFNVFHYLWIRLTGVIPFARFFIARFPNCSSARYSTRLILILDYVIFSSETLFICGFAYSRKLGKETTWQYTFYIQSGLQFTADAHIYDRSSFQFNFIFKPVHQSPDEALP